MSLFEKFKRSEKMKEFQPPKGTRDILPEEMAKYERVIAILRSVFEKYGFVPLETPAFENSELLTTKGGGGEAIKDEIYLFKDKSNRELGLRFDLTVPLARFVSNNPDYPKPFKRYQIGKVWRYDNPQAMRYREFWQGDIDIIGSPQMTADAEVLAVAVECLNALGFTNFYIRINNRKLLESILISAGVKKENLLQAFRAIDKLDKISREDIRKELDKFSKGDKILKAVSKEGEFSSIIKQIENDVGIGEATHELADFWKAAKQFGVNKYLRLDLSLVRGLEYYTGVVFELIIGSTKVSCGGGGRYDNLIKLYSNRDIPATGFSFGIDRVVSSLPNDLKSKKRIFVAPATDDEREFAIQTCTKLRSKGFICETDIMARNLSKQLEYARSKGINLVIIVGKEELRTGNIKIRDMTTGKERLALYERLAESL